MESFELNDFTLVTDGVLAPVEPDGDLCLRPFALASVGQFIIEADLAQGMADPYVGPSRFNEPFDRGYYLWKYGDRVKPKKKKKEPEPERPEQVRSSFIYDLWKAEAKRQAKAEARQRDEATRRLALEAAELKDERARAARDIRELELYIAELTREIESDLLSQVAAAEAEQVRQKALIARLEENRVAARDALLLVLEKQRRQNNQLLAVEAAIRFYY